MRIETKLCHVSENKAIVQVSGWINNQNLGSALAEGATVEIAEDKAITRLNNRINLKINKESKINSFKEDKIKSTLKVELPKSEKKIINNEPSDWSSELTAIDSLIERLNWNRDDENRFLEKNLGINNRNKITKYNDIVDYLNLLKDIEKGGQSKLFKENINRLIEESDSILRDLSWDHLQGREYLQKEFNVSTRKELNQEQLISFIEKLKSVRNKYPNQ